MLKPLKAKPFGGAFRAALIAATLLPWNTQARTKKRLRTEPRDSRSKPQNCRCAYADLFGNIRNKAIRNRFRNTLAGGNTFSSRLSRYGAMAVAEDC